MQEICKFFNIRLESLNFEDDQNEMYFKILYHVSYDLK